MEIAAHIRAIQRDGDLLAAAAQRAGLDAPVPSCPPWQVRDLLRHVSYVHRWAAVFPGEGRLTPVTDRASEPEVLGGGPPDDELLDWFRAGHAALVETLRSADPDVQCWMFLAAPSPLAFWARRQAHETAMHRVDAELADTVLANTVLAGTVPTPFPADFAADGIDELIMGFFGRDSGELTEEQRAGGRQSLLVRATDTGGEWLLDLTEEKFEDGNSFANLLECEQVRFIAVVEVSGVVTDLIGEIDELGFERGALVEQIFRQFPMFRGVIVA